MAPRTVLIPLYTAFFAFYAFVLGLVAFWAGQLPRFGHCPHNEREKMPQVFLSLRFGEALIQGEMIKKALEQHEITCFLCAVHEGDSIAKAVAQNLVNKKRSWW